MAATATPTEDHSNHGGGGDNHGQGQGNESGTLGPSPTNSGECHNRGDYWHCMGAEETGKPSSAGRAGVGMGAALAAVAALGM
ncbi:hypothetical protein IMZ48_02465 [Candidatus Bathyarchaeota archaeon]|nr:hypothetical protein [Candidatus Bathyarchaeota archaeon]